MEKNTQLDQEQLKKVAGGAYTPHTFRCKDCGHIWTATEYSRKCGKCGSTNTEFVS